MDINELINSYMNSNLSENIKNKRILILNTKLSKNQYEKQINTLVSNFMNDFYKAGVEYDIEPNLKHMLILLKGDILSSDFYKNLNKQFTIEELEKYVLQAESNGEKLYDLTTNIIFYKKLDEINEIYKDLKSILLNTINIVLDRKHSYLDENINNKIDNLLQNQILDNQTYKLLNEFVDYINNSVILLNQ